MKTLIPILFSLLLHGGLLAQNPVQYSTTRTAQHVQAPGSQVWLVPPRGFRLDARTPTGFCKDEFNYIDVQEMPGRSFATYLSIIRSFVQPETKSFQAGLEYRINGLSAYESQFFDSGTPRTGHHTLVIGNEDFVVLITFYYRNPETSTEAVAACLHSVFIDPQDYPDPLLGLDFSLDLTGTGYHLATKESEDMVVFAPELAPGPTTSPGLLLVVRIPLPLEAPDSLLQIIHQESLLSALNQNPPTGAKPSSQAIHFQGHAAFETLTDVTAQGQPGRLYQLTVRLPDRCYVVVALAQRDIDAEMPRLRHLIQRLRFR